VPFRPSYSNETLSTTRSPLARSIETAFGSSSMSGSLSRRSRTSRMLMNSCWSVAIVDVIAWSGS
jgi:hypothetical protein